MKSFGYTFGYNSFITNTKPKKIYKHNKTDWNSLRSNRVKISSEIISKSSIETDIEELWSIFKDGITEVINKHVPAKTQEIYEELTLAKQKFKNACTEEKSKTVQKS